MDALHLLADVTLADTAGNSTVDLKAAMILLSLRYDGERTTTGRRKRLASADAMGALRKSSRLASRHFAAPKSVAFDSKEARQNRKMLQEQQTALRW